MKILLVCYSQGGTTQGHMDRLKDDLAAERMVTIRAKRPYTGVFGAARAGREALFGRAAIEPPDLPPDMSAYDLVVLGAPVWAGRVAAPMRAFIQQYGQGMKRCAYVITHNAADAYEKVLDQLDGLTGVTRCASLSIGAPDKDVNARREAFVKNISEALP